MIQKDDSGFYFYFFSFRLQKDDSSVVQKMNVVEQQVEMERR